MQITVIGLGHLGTVVATGLAIAGHHVTGVDTDPKVIQALSRKLPTFYESSRLSEKLVASVDTGNLRFAHAYEATEDLGEIAIITTGTPYNATTGADLNQVKAALEWIACRNPTNLTIVMKSTVPPGSGVKFLNDGLVDPSIGYVANPEFLREGTALRDWQNPDQITLGAMPDSTKAIDTVRRMYRRMHQGITPPMLVTDITSAEMLKYASNAFQATRISFINEMASICDAVGASIDDVSEGLALDPRTGTRMRAGVGYGGSCLPKDTMGLERIAKGRGVNPTLVTAVCAVNGRQTSLPLRRLTDCFVRYFGPNMEGRTVGVLGLAFKPGTNDVRGAVAIRVINELVKAGANIRAYDPVASGAAMSCVPVSVKFVESPELVAPEASGIILLTEWHQIVGADWGEIYRTMAFPKFLFDGRNALDPLVMRELGFSYIGVGRGTPEI